MGRYYTGQIEGKFWFAIQDSFDASHFGREPEEIYTFYACSCNVSPDIGEPDETTYCEDCFESFEGHIEEMKKNEEDDIKTWYVSESEIKYNFEESDLDRVKLKVCELEEIVGHYMDSYKIEEADTEVLYSYDVPDDAPKSLLPLIAKLCLGKQIEYCLEKKGSCSFHAEL